MPPKALNKKQQVKAKNDYVHALVESLKALRSGGVKDVPIDLELVSVKHALRLIEQNASGLKLSIKLDDGTLYFLNDRTIKQLEKGKIDDKGVAQDAEKDSQYDEVVDVMSKTKSIVVERVEAEKDKTRPGGGFFKYYNKTKFDLSKYGIYKKEDDIDYSDNCLYIAFREGGMPEDQLGMLKQFVMNRIVPKCKLKEICSTLNICIKLKSVVNEHKSRVETYGNK